MSNIFNKVEAEAFRAGITPRTKESQSWFRRKVQNMRGLNRRALMREEPITMKSKQTARQETGIGDMFMFFYDAKHKDTLPYWDAFPLVIIVGPAKGGFYGLNLHYLPIPLRAKFLDSLMSVTNNKAWDENTKFQTTYSMLKASAKMKYFKPCLKHYLTSQVEGQLALVSPPEWEIATFLPTAQFQGNKNQVYKDSRSMI
jgi:hypothetical protein